jgi:hypothetical protein
LRARASEVGKRWAFTDTVADLILDVAGYYTPH